MKLYTSSYVTTVESVLLIRYKKEGVLFPGHRIAKLHGRRITCDLAPSTQNKAFGSPNYNICMYIPNRKTDGIASMQMML